MKQSLSQWRNKIRVLTVIILIFVPVVNIHAAAGINRQLNYQAKLADSGGVPVADGPQSVKFAVYDAAIGGTCLWVAKGTCGTPTAVTVQITNGVFSVLLGDTSVAGGSQNAMPVSLFDDDTRYLGVTVGADAEMSPRKRISAAPYAFNSDRLDQMDTSAIGGTNAHVPVTDSNGNMIYTGTPQGNGVTQGVMTINPGSANANETLFGVGVGGTERFRVDAEGDVIAFGDFYTDNNIYLNTSFRLSDGMLYDTNSDITIRPNGDIDDYLYFSTSGNAAGLFWEGATSNDPGIRINTSTNELEYRDENEATYTSFDSLATAAITASGWTDDGGIVRLNTSSDRVGIGTTTPDVQFELEQLGGADFSLHSSDTDIVDTDILGSLYFRGTDSDPRTGAQIRATSTGTWGTSFDAPTKLEFSVQDTDGFTDTLNTSRFTIESDLVTASVPFAINSSSTSANQALSVDYAASTLSTSGAGFHIMASSDSLSLSGDGAGQRMAIMQIETNSETSDTFNFMAFNTDLNGTPNSVWRVDSNGATYADGAYTGAGADYAERFYSTSTDLQPGEVVCVDIIRDNAVKRCTSARDGNVMGVVSSNPSIIGNSTDANINNPHYHVIGMLGQVPVKVTDANGVIRVGDTLTASGQPGYAMKADPEDPTLGVALEGAAAGNDVINVLISRRNQSLTVETVEAEVAQRVAALEIEDEVSLLISDAVKGLDLDKDIALGVEAQIQALNLDSTINDTVKQQLEVALAQESLLDQIKNNVDEVLTLLGIQTLIDTSISVYDEGIQTLITGLQDDITLVQNNFVDIESNQIAHDNMLVDLSVRMGLIESVLKENENLKPETTVVSENIFNEDSMGQARILAGDTFVIVSFIQDYNDQPIVNITPKGRVALENDIKYALTDESLSGFVIRIREPLEEDIIFNWVALANHGGYLYNSDGATESIERVEIDLNKISPYEYVELVDETDILPPQIIIQNEEARSLVPEPVIVEVPEVTVDSSQTPSVVEGGSVSEPIEPESVEPIEPEIVEPIEPEIVEPIEPEIVEPIEPESVEPIEPEIVEPIEPEIVEPIEPEIVEPIEPEIVEPIEPESEV